MGKSPRWPLLAGVWLIAFTLRALYIWQISAAPFYDLRIGDAAEFHEWARNIAAGDWIGKGVFYVAPLYPYLVAILYKTFGDGVTTLRLVQAGVGACSCACLAAAGMSLFGRRGAIAGALLAIYPSAIFLDGLLEKSCLTTFFMTALLYLMATFGRSTRTRTLFLAGVVLGLLALTRENALLLILPAVFWAARPTDRESFSTGAAKEAPDLFAAALILAGCALVLLPIGIRNYVVGGEFVLNSSQFGPNFYIGNHPGGNGRYEALVTGHGSWSDEREDATRLAEQAAGHRLSATEVSAFWTTRTLDFIRAQPAEWLKQVGRKFALTFNAMEVADTESLDVWAEYSPVLRLLKPFHFGWLFGLAVFGSVMTSAGWRRLWFLYAIGATYVVSLVMFYVFARYRFPIVPVLTLLAAGALAEVVRPSPARRGLNRARFAAAGAASVIAVVFAHLPLESPRASAVTHHFNIAAMLARDPARRDEAMRFYERALAQDPTFPAAQFGVGTLLARMGRAAEAIPHLQIALAAWPEHAELRYNLGVVLTDVGQPAEAVHQLDEAVRIRPDDADTHVALGKALLAVNQPDRAIQQYRDGLSLQPDSVNGLVGLGVALATAGRPAEAIVSFERALELDPANEPAHNNLGGALANSGRIADALPHFERAVMLNPGDQSAKQNLAQARRLLGVDISGTRQ